MATKDVYKELLEKSKMETFDTVSKSRLWFRDKTQNVNRNLLSPIQTIGDRKQVTGIRSFREIGSLFLFNYNPKTKDTLPYYDSFPIVFPFNVTKTGFLGLNLHYLPPPYRALLMDNLYNLSNSNDFNKDSTRLAKLTYNYLNSQRNLKSFAPCVKSYLNANIRSKIAFIPPNEWELALFLPLQRFQKQTETQVWKESIAQIKKRK